MIEIGTLVIDSDGDLGIIVGDHRDHFDGTLYARVQWLNGHHTGEELCSEPCDLEVIA